MDQEKSVEGSAGMGDMTDEASAAAAANSGKLTAEQRAEVTDLSNPDVVTKYRVTSEILNKALEKVVAACKPGKDVLELCQLGDATIEELVAPLYNAKKGGKKKFEKGVAFPTSVAVNEICGHMSPLKEDTFTLNHGDVVKIDMGAHIDGYSCVGAHTVVLPSAEEDETQPKSIEGRKADVLKAAWLASEAALRSIEIGGDSSNVSKAIAGVAREFECNPGIGVLSHQLKRFVLEGKNVIAQRVNHPEEKVEKFKFGANEVYAIDIVFSTGDGKLKDAADKKATIYKRAVEVQCSLRTQVARNLLTEINRRYPSFPFTLRSFEEMKAMKAGLTECSRKNLIQPYPVLTEKKGEITAQFKFTVLLLPSGPKKITGLPFSQDVNTEFSVKDEALKELLAASLNPKKKKKAAAAAEKEGGSGGAEAAKSANGTS